MRKYNVELSAKELEMIYSALVMDYGNKDSYKDEYVKNLLTLARKWRDVYFKALQTEELARKMNVR